MRLVDAPDRASSRRMEVGLVLAVVISFTSARVIGHRCIRVHLVFHAVQRNPILY